MLGSSHFFYYTMDNIEQHIFDALAQRPFIVTLGGKPFQFKPMSLSDRQEISVISSELPEIKIPEDNEEQLSLSLSSGKYSRQIADIITAGAHIRGWKVIRKKIFGKEIPVFIMSERAQRRQLRKYAYFHASTIEIFEAVKLVLLNSNPAFFLHIFHSLNQNLLKPTKETDQTAHGQSKEE